MVREVHKEDKILYICEVCGLVYKERAWAEKCEAWCREHQGTCSFEIAGHAELAEPEQ